MAARCLPVGVGEEREREGAWCSLSDWRYLTKAGSILIENYVRRNFGRLHSLGLMHLVG